MKIPSLKIILLVLTATALASCVTTKKLTYLQTAGTPTDTIASVTPADYKILPHDNLFIKVITPDPKWAEMFNTVSAIYGASTLTEQSADIVSYLVDATGAISLPYAGKVTVGGKTLTEATSLVTGALKTYIADPAVMIKMINNYVSLIGEVKLPGKYPIYKDRLTIFQALAMAGDMTDFSNRQKVQVIRQTKSGTLIKDFSLTDRSIVSTEFYYVMPNDVIYVQPMKGRFFHMSEFPYSLILSTLTTFVLFWNVLR